MLIFATVLAGTLCAWRIATAGAVAAAGDGALDPSVAVRLRPETILVAGVALSLLLPLIVHRLAHVRDRTARQTRAITRALQALELRNTAVLEATMDAVIVIDETGHILSVNPAAGRIFGWERDEAIGRDFAEAMLPPSMREYHRRLLMGAQPLLLPQPEYATAAPSGPQTIIPPPQRMEVTAMRRGGAEFPAEIAIVPVSLDGRVNLTAYVRDISDRRRAEAERRTLMDELNERVKELDALQQISRALQQPHDAVRGLLEAVVGLLPGAMRHADLAEARISHGPLEVCTDGFAGTNWRIGASLNTDDGVPGRIEVCYRAQPPCEDASGNAPGGSAFAPQEQALLDSVAKMLAEGLNRRRAEMALRLSEERYALAVHGSVDGMWDWNIVAGEVYFSEQLQAQLGYGPGEDRQPWGDRPTMQQFESLLHPDDAPTFAGMLQRHLSHAAPFDLECRLRDARGEYRWFRTRGQAIWDHHGTATRMTGSIADVDAHKRAESALAEREREMRQILDALGDMVFVKNERSEVIWANKAFREYFGISDEQVFPIRRDPVATADIVRERNEADARVFETGELVEIAAEPVMRHAGDSPNAGGVRRFHTIKAPIFDAGGKVRRLVAVSRDITERLELERAMIESRRFLQSTLDSLSSHIAILDRNGCVLAVNAAWRRFGERNGWSGCEGCVGMNYLEVCDRAHAADGDHTAIEVARGIRAVLRGEREEFTVEYPCHGPDEQRWFMLRATRFAESRDAIDHALNPPESPGRPAMVVRAVVAHLDITERKRAEIAERERRTLADAVAAMEQVLGVVGHELRTPLAGVRAMSEYLLGEIDAVGAGKRASAAPLDFLRRIHDEAIRMSDMVNNMLEAARLNSGAARWNWSTFDVEEVCGHAAAIVRPLIDPARLALRVEIERPGGPILMSGDADAVRRLVLNLLNNARTHTHDGHIDLRVREISDIEGRAIEIVVDDSGEGIPPDVAEKLGEAFALNGGVVGAPNIQGSGLGLAICRGIVAAHDGSMAIRSQLGRGTCVRVVLRADRAGPAQQREVGIVKEIAA